MRERVDDALVSRFEMVQLPQRIPRLAHQHQFLSRVLQPLLDLLLLLCRGVQVIVCGTELDA